MINPEAVFDAPSAKRIYMPTLKETHQADEIAKLRADVEKLKKQLETEKKKYRNLRYQNKKLRLACGLKVRVYKKSSCLQHYKPGMTGAQLAKAAGCSIRHALDIKKRFLENT